MVEEMSHKIWIKDLYRKVQMYHKPKVTSLLEEKNRWKPICK